MADLGERLAKNKAFLQQQERVRMTKPSSLAIDLRNKVVGECQAYQFGGVTHYLDDRGYLLAKRLMERFDGQYTIGVYEMVLKAIKTLSQTTDLPPVKVTQSILKPHSDQIQLLPFDKIFQRESLRILYTTRLEILLDDVMYHAATIDISSTSIRAVMKRAYTLNNNAIVIVNFMELKSKVDPELLLQVRHKIVKIEHDELRTHLILKRIDDTLALTNWFADWAVQHQSLRRLDVEHELLNIAHEFYLRLHHNTTKKPLIWLSKLNDPDPIKTIHLNPESEKIMTLLLDAEGKLNLSLLPIQQVVDEQRGYLAFISLENNIANSIVIPCDDRKNLALALSQPFEQVLLLQSYALSFSDDDFKQQFSHLFDINEAQANTLQLHLAGISQLITLSDISQSCRHLPQSTDSTPELSMMTNKQVLSSVLPQPEPLHHHIDRKSQRFLIHTDISLYLMDEHLLVSTLDVSEVGMSLALSGDFPVTEGTIVRINFIRWQSKTKKVTLSDIPFIVRRRQYWEGITTLGLERNVMACGKKLNRFFADIIEENRNQLALDNHDQFVIQESKLLGNQLTHAMPNLPFFLGLNTDKNRVIQAIAQTDANQADASVDLWQALSALATDMSELVRITLDNFTAIPNFGIYCYRNKASQWQIKTDLNLLSPEQKSAFINRALLQTEYRFFHCDLTGIKNISIGREPDLEQQLSGLRRHSPHHVRRIKELVKSLFAVGDLTDITPLIETVYQV
ncbi:MAG: hypothetical protein ACI9QV_000140 [Methylophagaceae bacterium]|jgi:hypothetical protein